MDKLTVYNRALSLISAAPYQAQTGVQHPCDLWYSHALLKANERADWGFARRRITLTEIPQSSIVNRKSSIVNTSAFDLPADCLKIRAVYLPGTRTKTNRREIYGRTLVTEISPTVDLDYTTNVVSTMQELPDAEPSFCQAVIYLLASLIAPEINGQNSNEHERYAALFEQEIQNAMWLDRKQTDSNDQSPLAGIYARRAW
jgi:hypothetical protein